MNNSLLSTIVATLMLTKDKESQTNRPPSRYQIIYQKLFGNRYAKPCILIALTIIAIVIIFIIGLS